LKKAGIIIIGFALAIFVTGHFFIFQISQNSHKGQFRSYMLRHLDQAVKINISPSELYSSSKNIKWTDGNKEVIINDQIYDVIGFRNSGTSVSLFIINDVKEKNMLNAYEELANSLNTPSSSGSKIIKDFLSLKYLQDPLIGFISPSADLNSDHPEFISDLSSVFISLENPPPVF
jgi:hypothetical protein